MVKQKSAQTNNGKATKAQLDAIRVSKLCEATPMRMMRGSEELNRFNRSRQFAILWSLTHWYEVNNVEELSPEGESTNVWTADLHVCIMNDDGTPVERLYLESYKSAWAAARGALQYSADENAVMLQEERDAVRAEREAEKQAKAQAKADKAKAKAEAEAAEAKRLLDEFNNAKAKAKADADKAAAEAAAEAKKNPNGTPTIGKARGKRSKKDATSPQKIAEGTRS